MLNFSSLDKESQAFSSIFPYSSSNLILEISSIPLVFKKSDKKSSLPSFTSFCAGGSYLGGSCLSS